MREVSADDARVVGQVPRPRRRCAEEVDPVLHVGSRRPPSSRSTRSFASSVSRSRSSLTARHHGLPGRVGIQRVEHTARLLPPHERDDRAAVRTIGPTHAAKRVRVCGKADPGRRIVAHLRHHPLGVMRGAHQATDSAGRSIRALTAVEIDAGEYRAMLAINQFRRPGIPRPVRDRGPAGPRPPPARATPGSCRPRRPTRRHRGRRRSRSASAPGTAP